jgi:alpha-beta hydrolase superfamily lysophospholipase
VQQGAGFYEGGVGKHHYRWWSADSPSWVILFAHGFGDHSGRYQRYAEAVVPHGGAVVCPDLRGHGLSDGERVLIEDFDVVAAEFLQVRDVPEFPTGVPVVLAGHSMGALVIARAATSQGELDVAGLSLSGARLGRWPVAEDLLAKIESGEIDPETGGGGHPLLDRRTDLPLDALSRDTSIVQQFLDDELAYRGPYPIPTLRAYLRAEQQLEEAEEGSIALPVLYMHGGGDFISPFRGSVDRLNQLVAGDFEVRIFPETRHSIFNELNRDEIFEVLLRFVDRVVREE